MEVLRDLFFSTGFAESFRPEQYNRRYSPVLRKGPGNEVVSPYGQLHSHTPVISASPVTLTWIAKVIWEGDGHITRGLGTGMPKTRGCPYHYNNGTQSSSCIRYFRKEKRTGVEMRPAIFSGIGQIANSPRSIYKILTWLRGLLIIFLHFSFLSCAQVSFGSC